MNTLEYISFVWFVLERDLILELCRTDRQLVGTPGLGLAGLTFLHLCVKYKQKISIKIVIFRSDYRLDDFLSRASLVVSGLCARLI